MIHFTEDKGIGIIEFDCPKGNLMSLTDLQEFSDIIKSSNALKGIIMKGSQKSFCTGLLVDKNQKSEVFKILDKTLIELFEYPNPLVSYLTGHAIGAGLLILCCSDYIVSKENQSSKFGLPEIKLGLGIDSLMLEILKYSLPFSDIKRMLLYSEYYDIKQICNTGIIDHIDDNTAIDTCKNYIDKINYLKSFVYCKNILRRETLIRIKNFYENRCYDSIVSLNKNSE